MRNSGIESFVLLTFYEADAIIGDYIALKREIRHDAGKLIKEIVI